MASEIVRYVEPGCLRRVAPEWPDDHGLAVYWSGGRISAYLPVKEDERHEAIPALSHDGLFPVWPPMWELPGLQFEEPDESGASLADQLAERRTALRKIAEQIGPGCDGQLCASPVGFGDDPSQLPLAGVSVPRRLRRDRHLSLQLPEDASAVACDEGAEGVRAAIHGTGERLALAPSHKAQGIDCRVSRTESGGTEIFVPLSALPVPIRNRLRRGKRVTVAYEARNGWLIVDMSGALRPADRPIRRFALAAMALLALASTAGALLSATALIMSQQ